MRLTKKENTCNLNLNIVNMSSDHIYINFFRADHEILEIFLGHGSAVVA